ncbi:hypothetical protein GC093_08270 [Paenibacillus sp. LMG 31456]|uniref:Uncharacterized protein n=1 Tax=Paenibacillus foliorum TaxID=2654974 RepID=A0A972GM15_9BACL|nr:hypothetical protein [Paenibacillus foliorum]NOU93214.1 hypothetical protein [Paenibacillus foliorum]
MYDSMGIAVVERTWDAALLRSGPQEGYSSGERGLPATAFTKEEAAAMFFAVYVLHPTYTLS